MIKTFKQLEDTIRSMQAAVIDVESLNNGGCGVFAAIAAKRLHRLGVEAVVKVASYNAEYDRNLLLNALKDGATTKEDFSQRDVDFDHVWVEVKWKGEQWHFDSNNFHRAKNRCCLIGAPFFKGSLNPFLALSVARSRKWCSRFDRKNIPRMISSLNKIKV